MAADRRLCGKQAHTSQCILDREHDGAHHDPQGREWPNPKASEWYDRCDHIPASPTYAGTDGSYCVLCFTTLNRDGRDGWKRLTENPARD